MAGKQVAMLGLAFKPNTDDMREAASIVIANDLVKMGARVVAYDPIATENAREYYLMRFNMHLLLKKQLKTPM